MLARKKEKQKPAHIRAGFCVLGAAHRRRYHSAYMEKLKNKDALYALTAVIILLAVGIGLYAYTANKKVALPADTGMVEEEQRETTGDESATTTPQSDESADTPRTETAQSQTTNTQPAAAAGAGTAQNTQQVPQVDLGPRQVADSPASALYYFARAMSVKDTERALTYIEPSARASYRVAFEQRAAREALHPVVQAYYTGDVADVELVDPEYGIYEIAVYPKGSQLPFRVRFAYNAQAGEFLILEL